MLRMKSERCSVSPGELDKAIGSFRKAVESYPEFEEALVGLGRTLVAAGDSRSALCPICRRRLL